MNLLLSANKAYNIAMIILIGKIPDKDLLIIFYKENNASQNRLLRTLELIRFVKFEFFVLSEVVLLSKTIST